MVSAALTMLSDWRFYPASRRPQSPPSCEIFSTCPLSVSVSSICYMMSGILTGQPCVLEDLGGTWSDNLSRRGINQHVMFLICPAPSVCCTNKLNLKVICRANGGNVHELGFVWCNLGDKKQLYNTRKELSIKLFRNASPSTLRYNTRGNFPGSILPSQRCVDKSRGRSFNDRPASPGDACRTPKRGNTASPNLFHFNTWDNLREEEGTGGGMRRRER